MGMDGSYGGMTPAEAILATNHNDRSEGMFGGNGSWVFFLFFLLAWGNGGLGGMGGNAAAQGSLTRAELGQDISFQSLENAVRGIQSGLCDGFYAQNTTMLNGFNSLGNQMAENRFAAQQCCCETNRNIDAVRFENAKNTCDIVNAIKADGDATRALMTQNTIQDLRDQLQAAQLQLSNSAQTSTLIDQLRPCARPAYLTCSPYQSNYYGYCGGCGA